MSHPRTVIRKAIAARLLGATRAGERVFDSRARELDERKDLPAILVYSRVETIDPDSYPKSGEDGVNERVLTLHIEAVMSAVDETSEERAVLIDPGIDDALDDFAAEVEAALEWFEVPGYESAKIRLSKTETEVAEEGRRPYGAARLTYDITYRAPWRTRPQECNPPGEVWASRAPNIGEAHRGSYERLA